MKILTLNAGSSSLKAALYNRGDEFLTRIGEAALSGVGSTHLSLHIDGKTIDIAELSKADPASIHAAVVEKLFECPIWSNQWFLGLQFQTFYL